MDQTEARKKEEIEFHDRLRGEELAKDSRLYKHYHSNSKFYSVDRANRKLCETWIQTKCPGKRLLDFCCGDGEYSLAAARAGAQTTGIDISEVAVRKSAERARVENLTNVQFLVRDAEATGFEDRSFDLILCAGVLHHLDLDHAYPELARLLAPGGEILCMEPLRYNPVFQWYRRLTPHLRTAYETDHILRMKDIHKAKKYFRNVDLNFFHLTTLAAVPFRNTPLFSSLLSFFENIDSVLMRIPWIQRLAWMAIFKLSDPICDEQGKRRGLI